MKNNIQQLRNDLNLSQEQLSEITDISLDELNKIENDQLEPSLIHAHRIKMALKQEFLADVFFLDELD